jgi:hypothetical protein
MAFILNNFGEKIPGNKAKMVRLTDHLRASLYLSFTPTG